jgi:hypothetical protein
MLNRLESVGLECGLGRPRLGVRWTRSTGRRGAACKDWSHPSRGVHLSHAGGLHPALSPKLSERLAVQYRQHPNWSHQLHLDNLAVLIEKAPTLGAVPSGPTAQDDRSGQPIGKIVTRHTSITSDAQSSTQRLFRLLLAARTGLEPVHRP